MLLAGDIGGTKTNLAVYAPEKGPRKPLVERTFPSTDFPSLETMVQEFLDQTGLSVEKASLGVAGPVVKGSAQITNLPWTIDSDRLQERFDLAEVHLLNDLAAIAEAVPYLDTEDIHVLCSGKPEPEGSIAVIAPGTGLGEAYLTWDGTRYRAYSSEGGHADFAPTTELQRDLLRYLHQEQGFRHVSYELVCSGKGLPYIYQFLKDYGYVHYGYPHEPAWMAEALAAAEDLTPVIVNAALDEMLSCGICAVTLNTFVSILGAEAGNMALNLMATGGVYLGGGIPPRILPTLDSAWFRDAFRSKGRLSSLLEAIPVYVILNPKSALVGAACYGLNPW